MERDFFPAALYITGNTCVHRIHVQEFISYFCREVMGFVLKNILAVLNPRQSKHNRVSFILRDCRGSVSDLSIQIPELYGFLRNRIGCCHHVTITIHGTVARLAPGFVQRSFFCFKCPVTKKIMQRFKILQAPLGNTVA